VLAAIAGHDARDESSVPQGFTHSAVPRLASRLRVGVPKGVTEQVQPAVRENFEKSLELLGKSATITRDVEWPDFPWGPAVSAIVGAEGASAFLDLIQSGRVGELRCPKDRHGGYAATLIPAVDYLQAMRLRRPMKAAVARLFDRFDVIASPTRAAVAIPADMNFEDAYPGISGGPPLIPAGNLCGLPAVSVPNGFGENGLPTGIAFMGAAFSESRLVAAAHTLQQQSDWHTRRPPQT